jgi:hypothetical protein
VTADAEHRRIVPGLRSRSGIALSLLLALFAGAAALAGPAAAGTGVAGSHARPAAGTTQAPVYGVAAATRLDQLPYLQPGTAAGGVSSFDRDTGDASHGNHDLNNFLHKGPDGNVMLDQEGPGCVYRIWMTSQQAAFPDQWIKIYFNGSRTPAIDMTIGQMFAGTNAPFLAPLVQDHVQSSGGYVSYVPLCYRSSVLIMTSMTRYYNIGYETFPPGTAVTTWGPGQSTAPMRAEWQNATADPISTAGNTVAAGQVSLDPGVPAPILDASGPDSVQSIKLAVPGVTAAAGPAAAALLDSIWIKIFWDGQSTPSVSAPLGSFFALGQFGSFPAHGLVAGIDDTDTLYMYLPMPFRHHAIIQLLDAGSASVPGISYEVQYRPIPGPFGGIGYLRTSYKAGAHAGPGHDIAVLSTAGSGKLVGITASYTGDAARSYLEGDERIYVDGSRSPAFYGTGTEDFYNGGYYFNQGPYSQPMSGNTAHVVTAGADETAAYRFMLQDAIEYRRRLVVMFQHGPYDNTAGTTASFLSFYYQRPAVSSRLTDTLNVGSAASERAHHYVVTGLKWAGARTYQYAGTADRTSITDAGRGYRGHSQFTIAVAPGNQGVDLRRRFDQGIADQKARVYVDGHLAGTWFAAGRNTYHRWADSDFFIPATLTAGKRTLTVRIQFVSAGQYFTDFEYWAYSITP